MFGNPNISQTARFFQLVLSCSMKKTVIFQSTIMCFFSKSRVFSPEQNYIFNIFSMPDSVLQFATRWAFMGIHLGTIGLSREDREEREKREEREDWEST